VAFSPNGQLLTIRTGGWVGYLAPRPGDEVVRVWDALTGTEVQRFTGHRGSITAVAFSPDGAWLAGGGADTTALLWEIPLAVRRGEPRAEDLTAEEFEALWRQLTADDQTAYRAIGRLARGAGAVPFLELQLRRTAFASATAERLIGELNSPAFPDREKAARELAALGDAAWGALRKALAGEPSAEVRRRVEGLLDRLELGAAAGLRSVRAIEVLEHAGTPDARQLLESLARGAPEASLRQEAKASLDRLARERPKR
jgi:hypothetical protein